VLRLVSGDGRTTAEVRWDEVGAETDMVWAMQYLALLLYTRSGRSAQMIAS